MYKITALLQWNGNEQNTTNFQSSTLLQGETCGRLTEMRILSAKNLFRKEPNFILEYGHQLGVLLAHTHTPHTHTHTLYSSYTFHIPHTPMHPTHITNLNISALLFFSTRFMAPVRSFSRLFVSHSVASARFVPVCYVCFVFCCMFRGCASIAGFSYRVSHESTSFLILNFRFH